MAAKLAIFGRRSASQHREFEMKLYPPFLVLIGILGQIIVGQFVPIEPVLGPVWQTIGIGLVVLGLVVNHIPHLPTMYLVKCLIKPTLKT